MRRAILWLLLFGSLSVSLAAETLTLTEAEAVRRALAGNLSLAALRTELRSTQLAAESAWGVLVPSLSASGSLSRSNREAAPQPPAIPYSWTASAQLAASGSPRFARSSTATAFGSVPEPPSSEGQPSPSPYRTAPHEAEGKRGSPYTRAPFRCFAKAAPKA